MIGAHVGDRGDEKQGCQNRAVIGACVGDRGETRLCHLASAARRPLRGRTRTQARPSRPRAIAGRKPRYETRPSGGEITEKRLYGAEGARIGMLPDERSNMKVYIYVYIYVS